jgi:HdeA/HdeB family
MNGFPKSFCAGSNPMNAKTAAVLVLGLLAACAQAQPKVAAGPPASPPHPAAASAPAAAAAKAAAPAPVSHIVDIRGSTCRDLLRLSPADRDDASMFYIGYQAARSRAATIDVSVIPSIEAQALTNCAENPDWPVAEAFAEAYSLAVK